MNTRSPHDRRAAVHADAGLADDAVMPRLAVRPQLSARSSRRARTLVPAGDVHDAVDDNGRRLRTRLGHRECPHRSEALHIRSVDLVERAVSVARMSTVIEQPVPLGGDRFLPIGAAVPREQGELRVAALEQRGAEQRLPEQNAGARAAVGHLDRRRRGSADTRRSRPGLRRRETTSAAGRAPCSLCSRRSPSPDSSPPARARLEDLRHLGVGNLHRTALMSASDDVGDFSIHMETDPGEDRRTAAACHGGAVACLAPCAISLRIASRLRRLRWRLRFLLLRRRGRLLRRQPKAEHEQAEHAGRRCHQHASHESSGELTENEARKHRPLRGSAPRHRCAGESRRRGPSS